MSDGLAVALFVGALAFDFAGVRQMAYDNPYFFAFICYGVWCSFVKWAKANQRAACATGCKPESPLLPLAPPLSRESEQ